MLLVLSFAMFIQGVKNADNKKFPWVTTAREVMMGVGAVATFLSLFAMIVSWNHCESEKAAMQEQYRRVVAAGDYDSYDAEEYNEWLASQLAERKNFWFCFMVPDIYDDMVFLPLPSEVGEEYIWA